MSYQKEYRKRMLELSERSANNVPIYYGLLTAVGGLLASIADELHELNGSLKNGQTVQKGSDQTRA